MDTKSWRAPAASFTVCVANNNRTGAHCHTRAVVGTVCSYTMLTPKDPKAARFLRMYDKYTLVLAGATLVAYGATQYFVGAQQHSS